MLIFVTPHIYYGAEGSVDIADEIERSKEPLVPKKKKGDKKYSKDAKKGEKKDAKKDAKKDSKKSGSGK